VILSHALTGSQQRQDGTVETFVPQAGVAIRRLTPLECERLQGFPDEWTRWLDDGTEQSDSARYRELGNAVAVPVVEWIAHRLAAAEACTVAEGAA
jgi:DNA (cytosine-5)-methyltransferase 1